MKDRAGKKRQANVIAPIACALGVVLASTLSCSSASAAESGPFGAGVIVGKPTGLSMNYRLGGQRSALNSVDAAVAWSFGNNSGFQIHSDYLWHRADVLRGGKVFFDMHYGVGGRISVLNDTHNHSVPHQHDEDQTRFGARIPIGLSTNFNDPAIEVFGETALIVNLVPSSYADLDLGVGVRVYF